MASTMKRRKFDEGGSTDDLEAANKSEESQAIANEARGEAILKKMRDAENAPKAKRIVSKKELEESGLSLRDFLNKERGLTRRGESAAPVKATAKTAPRTMTSEEAVAAIPTGGYRNVEGGERVTGNEFTRNVGNTLNALSGVTGAGAMTPLARNAMNLGMYAKKAGNVAGEAKALSAPVKRIGYDKAGAKAAEREARAAGRNEEMLRENARRYGLDPDNLNPETASLVRQGMGGSEFSLGMKKGGSVKKMAKGGMTSKPSKSVYTASSRADGIATKGKTRGKIC
jgi:hypothetical protein